MSPGIIIKIASFLTKRQIVCLRDSECRVYFTLASITPFGHMICPVYWFTNTGHCVLHKDGSVTGTSSYIEEWKFA